MRTITLALCWLIFGIGPMPAFAQPGEEAQKKLQGTWVAAKAGRDSKAAKGVVENRLPFKEQGLPSLHRDA